jgi:hypothetical protein
MAMEARKISFQEVWESSTIFYVDDDLEDEIDAEVESLLETASDPRILEGVAIEETAIDDFLYHNENALDVILRDIELSEEKFMRIISLLRKLGRIPGGFAADDVEWSIDKIKRKITREMGFAQVIARLLVDGIRDNELVRFIPRYYLDTLNYRNIMGSSQTARRIRYKRSMIGTYGGRKGYKVEGRIQQKLAEITAKHGIAFGKGRSRMIETDTDFVVPNVEDPWIIIMSTFQETTSSGQTNKTRDMLSAYERVQRTNSRYGGNRAFVNFVDGGGWLARKRDLERLVAQCHYFINLQHLDMLESIVIEHVPERYIRST